MENAINYLQKQKEKEQFQQFKQNMIGKTKKQLKIAQLNWIYQNNRLVYENLISDAEYVVLFQI